MYRIYIIVSNVNDRIEQNGLEQLVHVFDSSIFLLSLLLTLLIFETRSNNSSVISIRLIVLKKKFFLKFFY